MKLKLLFSLFITYTICSQDQPAQPPEQVSNNAQSILDIAKDIFNSGTGIIKSAVNIGKRFYKRSRQEAGYFGEELQSFIRTEQEIIAKQPIDKIATMYNAIQVNVQLDKLTSEEIERLASCTNPINLAQLHNELMQLTSSVPAQLTVHFVPQLRIVTNHHIPNSQQSSCTLTFRIKRPKQLYEWHSVIEEYCHFSQSISSIKDNATSYDSLMELLHKAYSDKILVDIVLS